jgi:type I restriction enzyme S subunit
MLGKVATFEMGQAPPGTECNKDGKGTLFVKAGEFGLLYPERKEWTTKPLKFGKQGDVFICVVGATAGKLNLGINCAIGRSVAAIRPNDDIDTRFVYYQLQPFVLKLRSASSGSAQGVISKQQLHEIPFRVVNLDKQREIVAEIEKQFSRLDEAVALLKRVKANLKRYRAAVLKAAFEGKLTEDWRKAHPDVEPASKLLERIVAERRAKWSGNGKYKEPTAPETADLPSLPKGWTWATVEQLSMLVQYGSSAKTHEEAIGVPVLRMGNIEGGRLRLESLKYLPKNHDEFPELFLREGDILFNRTNSAELVGKTAVYKGKPTPCSFASYLIRVRLAQGCAPDLLAYFINSVFGRAWIAQVVSQQVGQANVNGTKLQALAVPLPPLAEQQQVVAEVERRLSVIDELEATVEANFTRADRLRQSILNKAFSGALAR